MNKRKQTSICKKGRAGAKRDKCWVYEKGRGKWEAAVQESSIYPAWRQFRSPVFIPLGGRSGTQHLSRLAAVRKPSVYPAWQRFGRPAFIPLGSDSGAQCLSRLAAVRNPSVYPAWRRFGRPAFIPLGGCAKGLFADTEGGEDVAEQIVAAGRAGDAAEGVVSEAQVFRQ